MPQVRGQVDRPSGLDQVDGLVGDLGQHRVQRRDQHVHAEAAGHPGERRSHPSQRMAADALERRRAERDEYEIACVGRDGGDDAEEHDDVGQRPAR
jgi:hypothetical protein